MRTFDGKRVFVTGGSSGIGKAIALSLANSGAHVCLAARGEERLLAAADEVRAKAGSEQRISAIALDVADAAAVEQAKDRVLEQLGGLDLLINNAGIAHPARAHETPLAVYRAMMDVNYFGVVHVTNAFLPHFRAQRSGHISAVSSLLGFMGIYGYSAYAASKHAVTGFMDCLRQELLGHGVSVSVLFPGDTDTPQLHEENKVKPAETKAIAGNVKVMQPDAVAACLLRGIAKGRYHILPGLDARFTWLLQRHAPSMVRLVIDGDLGKHQKQAGVV